MDLEWVRSESSWVCFWGWRLIRVCFQADVFGKHIWRYCVRDFLIVLIVSGSTEMKSWSEWKLKIIATKCYCRKQWGSTWIWSLVVCLSVWHCNKNVIIMNDDDHFMLFHVVGDVPSLEENGHEAFDTSDLDALQREKILTRAMLKNYDDKLRSYRVS